MTTKEDISDSEDNDANLAIFKIWLFSATFRHEITLYTIDIDKKRFRTMWRQIVWRGSIKNIKKVCSKCIILGTSVLIWGNSGGIWECGITVCTITRLSRVSKMTSEDSVRRVYSDITRFELESILFQTVYGIYQTTSNLFPTLTENSSFSKFVLSFSILAVKNDMNNLQVRTP